MLTRRLFGQTAALLAGSAALPALAADAPEVLPIWPGDPPGGEAVTVQELVVERAKDPATLRDRYVQHVRRPTLTIFKPAKPNGTSLLMAPGGGYKWVVMDKEGYEAAELFAARGVTVFVMSYRLPHEGWAAGQHVASKIMTPVAIRQAFGKTILLASGQASLTGRIVTFDETACRRNGKRDGGVRGPGDGSGGR